MPGRAPEGVFSPNSPGSWSRGRRHSLAAAFGITDVGGTNRAARAPPLGPVLRGARDPRTSLKRPQGLVEVRPPIPGLGPPPGPPCGERAEPPRRRRRRNRQDPHDGRESPRHRPDLDCAPGRATRGFCPRPPGVRSGGGQGAGRPVLLRRRYQDLSNLALRAWRRGKGLRWASALTLISRSVVLFASRWGRTHSRSRASSSARL